MVSSRTRSASKLLVSGGFVKRNTLLLPNPPAPCCRMLSRRRRVFCIQTKSTLVHSTWESIPRQNMLSLVCWYVCSLVKWEESVTFKSGGENTQGFSGSSSSFSHDLWEAPILWPPDAKRWLIGKDPDVGKDWGQEEKGEAEDEMVGWHHWLNRYECEQTPGTVKDKDARRAAVHGVAESQTRQRRNNNEKSLSRVSWSSDS